MYRLSLICIFSLILAYFLVGAAPKPPTHIILNINNNRIDAELVSSQADIEKGLGDRNTLAANAGMLFVFSQPDFYGIWMKAMKFPIDILWLDNDMTVVSLQQNVHPNTYPTIFYPDEPAVYVLEINAGSIQTLHIKIGDKLRRLTYPLN